MATFKPKWWKKLKKALGFKDKEEEYAQRWLTLWQELREQYGVTDPNMWPNVPKGVDEMERCVVEMAAWQKGMTVEEYRKWLEENSKFEIIDVFE